MSAYEWGYLTGQLLVVALFGALSIKLLLASTTGKKVIGAALGLVALGSLGMAAVGTLARLGSPDVAGFERGFRESCLQSCGAGGTDAQTCNGVCECTLARLYANGSKEDAVRNVTSRMVNGQPTPELAAELEANTYECSADLYDQNFLAGCNSAAGAANGARCTCLLGQLRAGRGRGDGTRWLVTNVDIEPPSADGQASLARAAAACP